MAALIISTGAQFGAMTNQIVGSMYRLNSAMPRLQEAIATASLGYTGTPGTEFETAIPGSNQPYVPNLFGVQADPQNPGAQGNAYRYAAEQLEAEWVKFWTAAASYIQALDNGQ